MIYNLQSRVFVLISVIIITVICLLGPVVTRRVQTAQMKTIEISADAFATAFEQVKNGELPCADLTTLTDAEWDTIYVFGPYTSEEWINESLETKWKFSKYILIETNENITLLLFTKDKNVVAFIELSRGIADFAHLSGEVYNSDNACFSVDEEGKIVEVENP